VVIDNYFHFVGVTIFYTLLVPFQSKLELTCNKNYNNNKDKSTKVQWNGGKVNYLSHLLNILDIHVCVHFGVLSNDSVERLLHIVEL